jgi:predicted ATP-grasp superfamily ATP-dependent carboligase
MRIFIYEFVTGGGWYDVDPTRCPGGSLLAEGRAMVEAVARDFLEMKDVEVAALHDVRMRLQPPASKNCLHKVASSSEGEAKFLEQAAVSDFTLIIAPEFAGHLLRRTYAVERLGVKLLSPSAEFVATASDKWRSYQFFRANDIPTPQTWLLDRESLRLPDAAWPLVVKPIDGCGSQGVQLLTSPMDGIDWSEIPCKAIVQPYCAGKPASVAYLKHDITYWQLPACRQTVSSDGRFAYLGGDTMLSADQAQRACHLADAPRGLKSIGYFGVDLILGDAEDGSQDYVIEINPRLTTSYVGLRALSNTNLAQAMLDVTQGREPHLDWKPGRVRWSADGVVEYFEP